MSTMTTQQAKAERANRVALNINQQVAVMTKMTLGSRNFRAVVDPATDYPGLAWDASILPFTKSGERGTGPRVMTITVTLNPYDYYDVAVRYKGRGGSGLIEHFAETDVPVENLNTLLVALDYDGDTVTNPRMWM